MSRVLLRYREGAPKPVFDLERIRAFPGLRVLDETPAKSVLVDLPDEEVAAIGRALPNWVTVVDYSIPVPSASPTAPRNEAIALCDLADRLHAEGSLAKAQELYERAVERLRGVGDARAEASVLSNLGVNLLTQGLVDEGLRVTVEALKLHQRIGNLNGQTMALNTLAKVAAEQGRADDAVRAYSQLIEIHHGALERGLESEGRAHEAEATLLTLIARLHAMSGAFAPARSALDKAIDLFRELGQEGNVGMQLANAASIAWAEDSLEEARGLYARAVNIDKRVGNRSSLGLALDGLARVECLLGDLMGAEGHAREALDLHREAKDAFTEGVILQTLGVIRYGLGDRAGAIRLHHDALAAFARIPDIDRQPARAAAKQITRDNLQELEATLGIDVAVFESVKAGIGKTLGGAQTVGTPAQIFGPADVAHSGSGSHSR